MIFLARTFMYLLKCGLWKYKRKNPEQSSFVHDRTSLAVCVFFEVNLLPFYGSSFLSYNQVYPS